MKGSGTGYFKSSWSLPEFVTFITKGTKFAYCKLCSPARVKTDYCSSLHRDCVSFDWLPFEQYSNMLLDIQN